MRILLLGIFFFSILGVTDYLLVVIGKLKQYILFGCLALTLDIVLDLVFIRLGFGIEGIALGGTLITYFCYACIIIGYALSHYTRRLGDWVRFFFKLLWPYAYMVGLLLVLERWGDRSGVSGITTDVLTLVLQMVLFGLGCLPLAYAAIRELKLEWSSGQAVR
jgi:Na+-driven multidrug efflux pump